MDFLTNKIELEEKGYSILSGLYSEDEISQILNCLESANLNEISFLKSKDLFAIRQLIVSIPELAKLIFNKNLLDLISVFSELDYFLTKAIYFDKPIDSNWFVAYHQDLSISVNKKVDLKNYVNWTIKKELYGVQPPIEILENTLTVRIHLDDTNEHNGALKIIPKSHLRGIVRSGSKEWNLENEFVCKVKKGGVMLMKPLTLHASNRTTNEKRRRVIHLEFNTQELMVPLKWAEYYRIT